MDHPLGPAAGQPLELGRKDRLGLVVASDQPIRRPDARCAQELPMLIAERANRQVEPAASAATSVAIPERAWQ